MKKRNMFISKLTAFTLAATTIFSGNIMADTNFTEPDTIESAKEQVSIAQAEWESAKQEYDAIAEQVSGPKAEMEAAKDEYESISNAYHEAEEQETKARQDLENGPSEEQSIQDRIASQKEKIESESESLAEVEKEKVQAEEQLSVYQAEYETLQNRYESENAKLEQESEEMESCSQANVKAVSEMESLYNQKKSVYDSAKADYDKESETIKNLSNALEEAKEKESEAQKQYNDAVNANRQAQKKVTDAKAARDIAIEQESKGSIGFFEKQNATQALYDLRNCTYKEYVKTLENGATEAEAKKSATSLENMKQAFVSLHWHQDLIRSIGMDDLKITHTLMAHAQANADYSADIIAHSKQFSGEGENLSWGYKNPFDGWYTKEKAILNEAMEDTANYPTLKQDFATLSTYDFSKKYNSLGVGHYLNIINKTYQYTGMAYGKLSTKYSNTYSQEFRISTSETSYTLAEYEKMFNDYYNAIHADIDSYDKAVAAADEAEKQEEDAKTALEQAEEQEKSLISELAEHQGQLESYNTVLKDAENEFADVQFRYETLNTKVAEDNQKYAIFVQQYSDRAAGIQKLKDDAEAALNQKNYYEKEEYAQIIAALDTAQTNYDNAVLELEDLEKEYEELQERLTKAQQYLDEYSLLKETLEAELEQAKSVYEEKNEIYSEFAPTLAEKQAILTQCETNLSQATQKLEELEKEESSKQEETTKPETTKPEETSKIKEPSRTDLSGVNTNKKTTKLKKVKAKKKAVKITWKKISGVAGYHIQYATNKNFKKAKIKIINKAKTTSKTIKKLRSKKKYYFRIRTFIKSGNRIICSKWSKAKKAKVK